MKTIAMLDEYGVIWLQININGNLIKYAIDELDADMLAKTLENCLTSLMEDRAGCWWKSFPPE